MLIEIQVSPRPLGSADRPYAHVDAAIAVIKASGLTHEVGALGTTVEGPPDQLWPLLRAVHEAAFAAGAEACSSAIKIAERHGDPDPTIASLTAAHRP